MWICCFCINQHRVVHQLKTKRLGCLLEGFNDDLLQDEINFYDSFKQRVTGIGHLLVMLSPWNRPEYLDRLWCIFEYHTAFQHGCTVSIVLPGKEKESLESKLIGINGRGVSELYDALAKTDVQRAKASFELDKQRILRMIEKHPGYGVLNNQVNNHLREWVRATVRRAIVDRASIATKCVVPLGEAKFYNRVCCVLKDNGEFEIALEMAERALESVADEDEVYFGPRGCTREIQKALAYSYIGSILFFKADYNGALKELRKALSLRQSIFGKDHPETAASHAAIGNILAKLGMDDIAMEKHTTALKIRKQQSSTDGGNVDLASSYADIGSIYCSQGDYRTALCFNNQALNILGRNKFDPVCANIYSNIGRVYLKKGDYDMAMVNFEKTLEVQEKVLGKMNHRTAACYHNIGTVLYKMGDFAKAGAYFQQSQEIFASVFGAEHPEAIASLYNLAFALDKNGCDYNVALNAYRKAAESFKKINGPDNRQSMICSRAIHRIQSELLFS